MRQQGGEPGPPLSCTREGDPGNPFFRQANYYSTAKPSSARGYGIQQWMRASLPGWRWVICLEILSAHPPASSIGWRVVDGAAVWAERDHAIVAQASDGSHWIPRPSGLLYPVADGHVGKGDAYLDDLFVG